MSQTSDPSPLMPPGQADGPTGPKAPPAASPAGQPVDHLAKLHHMSTTAGVSSQEYVAINPWSVATVIFGVASALALLAPVLLIIPLVGVICGLIALPQIRSSNGTQTGRGLAWFGLALSVGLTAVSVGQQVSRYVQDRRDTQQIVKVIDEMWGHLQAGRWQEAYALYDDRFQEGVSAKQFAQQWQIIMTSPVGRIKSIRWNRVDPRFAGDEDGATRLAYVRVNIEFENQNRPPNGETLGFRNVNGQWRVNSFATVFPAKNVEEMLR